MSESLPERYYPGLEGVISSETAISNIVEREGAGVLEYRGYRIEDLASRVGYEQAAFLLLHGDLPNRDQLRDFDDRLRASRSLPDPLVRILGEIPAAACPMDVLRTSVSILAHYDPDQSAAATDHAANVRKAERLIARMATAVACRERLAAGQEPVPPDDRLGHAANFLRMVSGKVPSEKVRRAFDGSLVLYAEHELNASTFAARVTVSTLSDLHSGIVAAVGTLKGTLHGGANEEAWKLVEAVGSPDRAEAWIQDALARHERVMGFGHRVYKKSDPRAAILKAYCREIAAEIGDDSWERIAEPIERAVVGQKGLPPNVDWPSARLYHYMGLPLRLYTPIFAMARVAGWSAHVIEQIDHNRLLRPRGRYIGPTHRQIREVDDR
ncbi:citrate/2-methylcitrate synthase [Aquisphaera insulae]|uniref:citrate/2-methylcitrate synthase n=1 Tax=Aquisphaera insulae TaxID=2712864 RepID=UPI0013EC40E1|nr:citrate/2-methylcitrate synthase [Aquisphaera insulae]